MSPRTKASVGVCARARLNSHRCDCGEICDCGMDHAADCAWCSVCNEIELLPEPSLYDINDDEYYEVI